MASSLKLAGLSTPQLVGALQSGRLSPSEVRERAPERIPEVIEALQQKATTAGAPARTHELIENLQGNGAALSGASARDVASEAASAVRWFGQRTEGTSPALGWDVKGEPPAISGAQPESKPDRELFSPAPRLEERFKPIQFAGPSEVGPDGAVSDVLRQVEGMQGIEDVKALIAAILSKPDSGEWKLNISGSPGVPKPSGGSSLPQTKPEFIGAPIQPEPRLAERFKPVQFTGPSEIEPSEARSDVLRQVEGMQGIEEAKARINKILDGDS
jgi:hypothetical protein